MRTAGIAALIAVLLVGLSQSAIANVPPADAPPAVEYAFAHPAMDGRSPPRSRWQTAQLACDATGLGGGSCPSYERCIEGCYLDFEIEVGICVALGAAFASNCIGIAANGLRQCKRDCAGRLG